MQRADTRKLASVAGQRIGVAGAYVRGPGARRGRAQSIAWGPWKGILFAASGVTVLLATSMLLSDATPDRRWTLPVAIASLLWLACYLACTYCQFRTVFLLTTTYIITLMLFHLGTTIPIAFGFFDLSEWDSGPFAGWLELSGWSTVLALGSVGVGFALGLRRRDFRYERQVVTSEEAKKNLAILYRDGIGLLLASAVFLAVAVATLGNLLNYSRVDFFRGVGDTRGLGVFLMTFPSAAVALVIGATSRTKMIFATFVAATGVIAILFSGYRATAMFPLLVGVVLWSKTGRKVPLYLASALLILTLFAISASGLLRTTAAYKDIDLGTTKKAIEDSSIENSFRTMGQTEGILAHVLRLVPASDPFRHGETYLLAMRSALPNVLPKMSESQREKGRREALINQNAINELIPSDWLTYRIARGKFDVGEGVGFTAIGEPYLNFGFPGIFVVFAGLGFLFSRLEASALLKKPNLLTFVATMFWPLVSTVRQDIGNFIKPAVFVLIILVVWRVAARILLVSR